MTALIFLPICYYPATPPCMFELMRVLSMKNAIFSFFLSFANDFKRVFNQFCTWSKQQIAYLQMEYSSGGNIRFEEGSTADVW